MGQAKNRGTYAERVAQAQKNQKVDLNNYFWNLGDGEAVDKHRVDIVKGLLNVHINNIDNLNILVKNAKNKKTSGQNGFAFQVGTLFKQFAEFHVGPESNCDVDTMLDIFTEFLQAENPKLSPCMTMNDGVISQGWGYIGSKGNLSIRWAKFPESNKQVTFVSTVKAETCNTVDMSEADITPDEFAKKCVSEIQKHKAKEEA